MRALYVPDVPSLNQGDFFQVEGEHFRHLKVARIERDERVLLLKGDGSFYESSVKEIRKKDLTLEVLSYGLEARKYDFHLLIGLTKKEAFEEVIKFSVELGISQITPLLTDFSQQEAGQLKRADKLIGAAIAQSNNRFAPQINPLISLDEALENLSNSQEQFVSFTSDKDAGEVSLSTSLELKTKLAFLIGPEGGFSANEEKKIAEMAHPKIYLPTPILRAPTAVCVASGFLLKSLSEKLKFV